MICQWSLHKFFLNERAPSFCHDLVIDPFYRMKRPMTLCRIWAVLKLTCSETGLPLREEKGHTMVWLWKKPLNNSWASTANWFIYFIASLGKAIFLKFFKTIRKFPGQSIIEILAKIFFSLGVAAVLLSGYTHTQYPKSGIFGVFYPPIPDTRSGIKVDTHTRFWHFCTRIGYRVLGIFVVSKIGIFEENFRRKRVNHI